MVLVKWKNGGCSEAGLQLMTECSKKIEEKILKHQEEQRLLRGDQGFPASNEPGSLPFHVPTALNDELHTSCIAVAVSHNSGMWSLVEFINICRIRVKLSRFRVLPG
jgi:hypothetical protein